MEKQKELLKTLDKYYKEDNEPFPSVCFMFGYRILSNLVVKELFLKKKETLFLVQFFTLFHNSPGKATFFCF